MFYIARGNSKTEKWLVNVIKKYINIIFLLLNMVNVNMDRSLCNVKRIYEGMWTKECTR